MSIDFQALRDAVDLPEIARRYTTLNRSLQGPCPLCGGQDRFYIHKGRQRWGCRHCREKGGDAVDLVALCENVSKIEAGKMLTGDQFVTDRVPVRPVARKELPANVLDQEAASQIIMRGVELLAGSPGLAYAESRGLSAETLARYRIGFDPQTKWNRPALVIPWQDVDGTIRAIKYRFLDEGDPRYGAYSGSKMILFGAIFLPAAPRLCVVVEGEINALSVSEALGTGVAALSIGGNRNTTAIAAAAALLHDRYSGLPIILWLDEEKDVKSAARAFKGKLQGLKSPGLDANDILVRHGRAGLREFLLPSMDAPVLSSLERLRRQLARARSKSECEAVVKLLEDLYDETQDEEAKGTIKAVWIEAWRGSTTRMNSEVRRLS